MKLTQYACMAALCLSAIFQSGCLKKSGTFADDLLYSNKSNLVELRQAEGQELPDLADPVPVSYAPTPAEENLLVGYVRLASATLPTTPVTVKVKLNNTFLRSGFVALPANAYTFVTPLANITIPVNTRFAEIRINLNKQLLDPAVHYALGLELEDAGAGNVISRRSQRMIVLPEAE